METFFYFIRHGETDWNRELRLQGHKDIPLNENGLEQAKLCSQRLVKEKLDKVMSSDLQRAIVTANAIAENFQLTVESHPAFRERHYGCWEGLTREEIQQRSDEKAQIESLESMQSRAMHQLQELIEANPGKSIAIVSHGGLINSVLHYISNGEIGTGITKLDNTSISLISYGNSNWRIHYVNECAHLSNVSR